MTLRLNLHAARVQTGTFLGPLLIPETRWKNLCGVASVLVFVNDLRDLVKKSGVERDGIKAKVAELAVGHLELVLGGLLPGVREEVDLHTGLVGDELRHVANAPGLGDLVEYLDALPRLGGIVDRDFDAPGGVSYVDEPARLSSGAVNSEGHAHRALHEEAVQDGAVISVVVEAVHEALVSDGLRGVGPPHDPLVKVGYAELVVLLVELPQECVEALGRVVHRSGVGGVEDVRLPPPR